MSQRLINNNSTNDDRKTKNNSDFKDLYKDNRNIYEFQSKLERLEKEKDSILNSLEEKSNYYLSNTR